MRKTLLSLLVNLISNPLKGVNAYRQNSMDLAKIKMSLLYIKGIETSRLLFVSLLSVGVCLIFFITGLVLFHATLFLYTPWDMVTKMYIGFSFAMIYLLVSVIAFSYIFSQAKWLKMFHAEGIVDNLIKKPSAKTETENQSNNGHETDENERKESTALFN